MLDVSEYKTLQCFLIVGYARTGQAAENFCLKNNKKYYIYDDKVQSNAINIINNPNNVPWNEITALILSAGIPNLPVFHPIVAAAREKAIPVYSDLDILYFFNLNSKFIGITGSLGKTTIHDFLYKLIKKEYNVAMGGNNGIAALSLSNNIDNYLLEVSSTQNFISQGILYDIAVINNIFPIHEEFGSHEIYRYSKEKILMRNKSKNQKFVVGDFPKSNAKKLKAIDADSTIIALSDNYHTIEDCKNFKNYVYIGASNDSNNLVLKYKIFDAEKKYLIPTSIAYNIITIENLAIAFAVGYLMNIPIDSLLDTLSNYCLIDHRIDLVYEKMNKKNKIIKYFNCSKCTNAFAFKGVISYIDKKLNCIKNNNIFLIGGQLNSSVEEIFHPLISSAYCLFIYGADGEIIYNHLLKKGINSNKIKLYKTMKNAVNELIAISDEINNDVNCFLTPCCQSFDEFKDFEERGKIFTELVMWKK